MDIYLNEVVGYLAAQSWQIAVLIAAVAAVTFALRRHSAHVRYLLWLIVLAKCLVPPLQVVPLQILPRPQPGPGVAASTQFAGAGERLNDASPAFPDTSDLQSGEPLQRTQTLSTNGRRLSVPGWLGVLWITGAGAYLAMNLLRAVRGHYRLRRSRLALPDPIQAQAESFLCPDGVGRLPTIWMVEKIGQPFVWGLVRGSIYVPPGFLALANPEHRRDILAHEFSHVLRFDAGINTLQVLAQGLFWFHPPVWWASRQIRREREKCCDEMVIARMGAQPRSYGRAIVEALLVARGTKGLVPSLAIAGPARNIEERIKTLLQPGRRFHQRPSLWAVVCVLLAALLIVPTTLALTSRPPNPTNTAAPQVAAETSVEPSVAQRTLSADNLKKLGLALTLYATDHEGKYPDNLMSLLAAYIAREDAERLASFISGDAEYLGAGKTRREDQAFDIPLAYDLTLLRRGAGTNVVFADGHVAFVSGAQLDKYGIKLPESRLEILNIRFEPIHQGKNVVHVTVKNASDAEQVFAAHIYTRSPDYGRPSPNPAESGVGWGTGGYFETLRPGETKPLRLVFKIQGPVTDRTYVNLRFYNPAAQDKYESKRYFEQHQYASADLEKARTDQVTRAPASPAETQAVIRAFTEMQSDLQEGKYEQVWERFTKDYQKAEYQVGFEWFRRAMEPTHPMHSAFTWERGDFPKLKPGQVFKSPDVLTLAATLDGQTWSIAFVRQDNQWKIDWIAGYIPAVIRMEEKPPVPAGGSGNLMMPQEKPPASTDKTGVLKVMDVQFEPIRLAKNTLRVSVCNSSDQERTFGIDIRVESFVRNWQSQKMRAIKANTTEWMSFDFEVLGPLAEAGSLRLRFYNPPSATAFDIRQWFEERRYTGEQLPLDESLRGSTAPVSDTERQAVIGAFDAFRRHLQAQEYEAAWGLVSQHLRSMSGNDARKFAEQLEREQAAAVFLKLVVDSVTRTGPFLTLHAGHEYTAWKLHFIQENGQWKLHLSQPDTQNWEQRVLPQMEKRSTAHFDIYYGKDSTAAREIDQLARQKDEGFGRICQFLAKDSDLRIRLVLFEDGKTKQMATGHQGAGWAYGNTIVEVYNEKEKLDPYHETTHILMSPLGHPPALFNEGFAVYMSERLGAPALQSLSGGRATIDQRARELKNKGEWIELRELLGYTEIGSASSRPPVAYPEAASFVKFLIDTDGKDKFLRAYQALRNSNEEGVRAENIKKLEKVYGKPLQTLQEQWEAALVRS